MLIINLTKKKERVERNSGKLEIKDKRIFFNLERF
jgi:hypothetical protein